ncbi:hypothetical protein NDU88_000936 [Pleurodeles waltl]|uniref:Uncharacterized protein n=1 Tax=Pleurodeles waltl TaxID=8319 RepID=A0AAV7MRB2_PLEWA|nr:hypothetical protein NDU88_000936 [Pleurodeles waltl]
MHGNDYAWSGCIARTTLGVVALRGLHLEWLLGVDHAWSGPRLEWLLGVVAWSGCLEWLLGVVAWSGCLEWLLGVVAWSGPRLQGLLGVLCCEGGGCVSAIRHCCPLESEGSILHPKLDPMFLWSL